MGVKPVRTASRSPWQNPYVERFGGTLRREQLQTVWSSVNPKSTTKRDFAEAQACDGLQWETDLGTNEQRKLLKTS